MHSDRVHREAWDQDQDDKKLDESVKLLGHVVDKARMQVDPEKWRLSKDC